MLIKKILFSMILAAAFCVLAVAQPPQVSVVAGGLRSPSKVIAAGQTHLLVAEAGNRGQNNGRISLVHRGGGAQTLLDGLPSEGPSGLELRGVRTLYVTIGGGDATNEGENGTALPNPFKSSLLFASVLEISLPAGYEELESGFIMSAIDQQSLLKSSQISLTNNNAQTLSVRLLVKLPEYKREPRPGVPINVRPSNPYGVRYKDGFLYVADASFNQIYKINADTGEYTDLAIFPPKPNPLPFGPPVYEIVPDSVRFYGDQLLVTNLTGFPFPQNKAQVQMVDTQTGAFQMFIDELTAAIDVLPVPLAGNYDSFYVLEFTADFLAQPQLAPGRLKLFVPPNNINRGEGGQANLISITLLDNLISPTSMARDPENGDIFITENFTGLLKRVSATQLNPQRTIEK